MGSRISAEKTYTHSAVDVIFKTQSGLQDRRHLVVVFSGFCPLGSYNFDGTVANGCRFDILWIKDEFDGNNSYYLSRGMNFDVEEAVIALIRSELNRLDLSLGDCTLMGYSKGGTAALYYGLKYGFKNMVASGPQINFASFARDHFNSSFRHMTLAHSEEEVAILDDLLPNLLREVDDPDRNIYLISSTRDQFHESQIVPWLDHLRNFSNFNLLMTESDLVPEHKYLGAYNTPLVLSLLYSLGEGLVPAFLTSSYGGILNDHGTDARRKYLDSLRQERRIILTLDRISMKNGLVFPEGVALMAGYEQPGHGYKKIGLRLVSSDSKFDFAMGSYRDSSFTNRFFDRYHCDYFGAGYKSLDSQGIDLGTLPDGAYDATMVLSIEGEKYILSPTISRPADFAHFHDGSYFYWETTNSGLRLVKRSIVDCSNFPSVFELRDFSLRESRLFIEGIFAVSGLSSNNYESSLYSLVLKSEMRIIRLPLAQGHRPNISRTLESGLADHSKAYFATSKYAGLDLSGVEPGLYECYISWHKNGRVFSKRLDRGLAVNSKSMRIVQCHSLWNLTARPLRRALGAVKRRMLPSL